MTRTSKELLALTLALGLVACNKSGSTGTPSVTFVSLTRNEVLTADAGTVLDGLLTFEVTATVSNAPAGSTLALRANDVVVNGTSMPAPAGGSGEITLTVTLSGGDPGTNYALQLELDSAAGTELATATDDITVLLTSSGVCAITISPPNGTLFNETGTAVQSFTTVGDEDLTTAGMQAKITVTVGTPCQDGSQVTLTVGAGTPLTATLSNGVAVFDETSLPDTSLTALSNPSEGLSVVAAAGTGADASTLPIRYYVYSQNPTISITSPLDGAMIPQADNPVDILGITDLAAQLQLFPLLGYKILAKNGGVLGTGMLLADGGFSVAVPLPSGVDVLTAQVTDAFENIGTSVPVTATVIPNGANCSDAGPPTVAFITPTVDAGINLTDDGDALTPGLQVPLRIMTASLSGSAEFCSTAPPKAVGATPCPFNANLFQIGLPVSVSSGFATLDDATLGDDGTAPDQTLTAQVTDGTCGTQGEGSVVVEVHAIQPVIDSVAVQNAFGNPDGGCVWLNSTNLQNGTAQTTVLVTVDGSDMFGDGGPMLAITGTIGQNESAPLNGSGAQLSAQVPISLPDGVYQVSASIMDVWGNPSADAGQLAICVKTSLPTCTISDSYSNGCFNIQDNQDAGAASGVVPVVFTVIAANASATGINGSVDGTATVTINGGSPTSDPINNAVSVTISSAQGADVYSATVTDPAGNPAATCAPAALSLNVSTVAPTFAVTPQSAGNGQDDAGCEIYLTRDGIGIGVATTDIANGASITVQATGASGGSSAKTPATVTASAATVTLSGVSNGIDTVTASGTDSCGNVGTGSACIDVQATGCDLSLVSPVPTAGDAGESVVFNASEVSDGGLTGLEFHTSCAAGTQVQFDSTASGGSDQPQDGGVDSNGDVTFDLTSLVDGSSGTFTSSISGGESLPTIAYEVKLTVPAFTGETPIAGSLEIVANQDNLILSDAGVTILTTDGGTIIANEVQCATSACADFTLTGISGLGPVDGNGNVGTASLALSFPGQTTSNPSSISIASGTTTVTFSAVSLPAVSYPTAGTVTLTLTDNVGNTITETWTVTTDSLQPAAPSLTASMADKRAASVKLSWTVPATGGDSDTQGYELAYVINNLSVTPPTTPSEATYGTWTLDPNIAGVSGAVGTPVTYTETNLPTLNQYTFELRAIDAVGNRSPLTTSATAVSVSSTDSNAWQTATLLEPGDAGSVSDFGYVLRTGDFNGDGKQDLVITAPYQYASDPTPGVVYILNGATDLSTASFTSLSSITLGGTDFDWFGQDAHVADYNGDGIDDLAVGSPEYNSGQGRVDIFFGSKPGGLPASPSTTILGDSTQAGMFGYSVSAVDVNGDGIPDLLVGAPEMGTSGNGASYLFLATKAWPLPDAGSDVTSATSVISGNAGDGLGARWGSVAIGDINGDGDGDFVVGAPGGGGTDGLDAGPGSVYGFSGATALANATMTVGSNALFTLAGRTDGFCDPVNYGYASGGGDEAFTLWGCFGANAIGDVSFTGGALPDLIVSSDYFSTVFLFDMTKTGPTTPAASQVSDSAAGAALGWSMVAPDLNGDGHPDLLSGENNAGTPNVFLFLNTGTGLPTAQSGELFGPGNSYFGYGLAAGAMEGADGGHGLQQDFAVSNPYPAAYVNVYY